jgi:hypothetical protein
MRTALPVDCSGRELRLRLDLDVRCDFSAAPGGVFLSDVKTACFCSAVGYASGTLGLGLAQIFFTAWIADGRLTYVPAYLHVNSYSTYLAYLPHRHQHRHRHHSSIIVIVAVHLLFKWNIYLSHYVIGWFLLSKN